MRKLFITPLIILMLMLFFTTGCVKAFRYSVGCAEIKSGREFSFFVISDMHHLSGKLYDSGAAFNDFLMSGDGKLLNYTEEILDALVGEIKTEAPDFIVFTGDLTCNGEKESHLELVKKLEYVESMGTCVFVVPGNHDIQNPWASSYLGAEKKDTDTITKDEYMQLYGPFGYEEAISVDPNSLSYLAMPTEDTWLLMLDSVDHESNMRRRYPEQAGRLKPQTIKWVEQCAGLARDNSARLVAVMHHSLMDHSNIISEDYTISDSDMLLKLFGECSIEIVLTGHIHLQDIKTGQHGERTIHDIATGSLSVYPHQYGRMEFVPGDGFYYNTVLLDMKSWAEKNQNTDMILYDFRKYSSDIFTSQCCKSHKKCLSNTNGLSDEDMEKAISVLQEMNLMYFSGYRNEALDRLVNTEAFKILETMPDCFSKDYVMSMLRDERADNNKLHIPCRSSGEH